METLSRALSELRKERIRRERELQRLDDAILAIGKLVGRDHPGRLAGRGRPRRQISAAARRRIAAAQKARWKKLKRP